MKKSILSLLLLFIVNLSHSQCFFGFEHINTVQNDSALVIHKNGFPNYTDFTLYQDNNSGWIIDTTLSNQTSDTLLFGVHADSIGQFKLYGISSAGDTLGYAINTGFPSQCYPVLFDVGTYWPPSSISAQNGSLELVKIDNGSDLTLMNGFGGQNIGDSILIYNLTEGIKTASFVTDGSGQDSLYIQFIIGDPSNWANIQSGTMTCPIGINLATDQNTCDGEAYVGQVQNSIPPYSYDWSSNGVFSTDTIVTGLCVGNHEVTIQDVNGDIKTCAFTMGSLDNGYFPPTQTSDTTIHTFTDYCMDTIVDSVSLVGSEVIDSVSFSIVWSFYSGTILVDQILDTFQITVPNGIYNNVELYLHLVCDGDTLKSSSSIYSTYGYISLPFSETGYIDLNEIEGSFMIKAYPNPIENLLNIELNNSEIKEILVLNEAGQEVNVEINAVKSSHVTLDFSEVSKGNYIIQVYTNDNVKHIKKVVKN